MVNKFYEAMINYLKNEQYLDDAMIEKCKSNSSGWLTADEWGITPQRLTAMYNAGMVYRVKNKQYYGDNKYRYWPVVNV